MNGTPCFFTADTHFGHTRVIEYSQRPFKDATHMDEVLIANWNAVVRPDAVVYHLGDVSFSDETRTLAILRRLNGRKFLVLGNHDTGPRKWESVRDCFVKIVDYLEVNVQGQRIVMSHFPMLSWHRMGAGAWMLHGHCHNNLAYPFRGRIADVGVDAWGYTPVSFNALKTRMDKVVPEFLDHHRSTEDDTGAE